MKQLNSLLLVANQFLPIPHLFLNLIVLLFELWVERSSARFESDHWMVKRSFYVVV